MTESIDEFVPRLAWFRIALIRWVLLDRNPSIH